MLMTTFVRPARVGSWFLALAVTCTGSWAQSTISVAGVIGITPESLVIAEVDVPDASMILSRIEAAQELQQNLMTQFQVAGDAAASLTTLAQQLIRDGANEDLLNQRESALQQLDLAKAAIQDARQALFEAAVDGLPPQRIARLITWRHGARHRVDAQIRVTERSPEQWRAIERAVRAERRALRRSEQLADEPAAILNNIRSHPHVIQAAMNLQTNLGSMRSAFDQFNN